MSESLRLVIALAYGDTIRQWEEKGLFDRELGLPQRHAAAGRRNRHRQLRAAR